MYPVLLTVEVPFPGSRSCWNPNLGKREGGLGGQRRRVKVEKVEKVEGQGARVEASDEGQGQC